MSYIIFCLVHVPVNLVFTAEYFLQGSFPISILKISVFKTGDYQTSMLVHAKV
jgi:hypothetical protein